MRECYLNQYYVTYIGDLTVPALNKLGTIIFSSKVVNMIILNTKESCQEVIKKAPGVLSVVKNTKGKVYGHKK